MDYISGVFALIGGYFTLSEIELAVLKTQVLLEVFREHKLTCCANLFRCICKLRKGKNPLLLLVGRLSAKR